MNFDPACLEVVVKLMAHPIQLLMKTECLQTYLINASFHFTKMWKGGYSQISEKNKEKCLFFFFKCWRALALYFMPLYLFCNISFSCDYNTMWFLWQWIELIEWRSLELFHGGDSCFLLFSLYCTFSSTTFLNGVFSSSQTPRSVWP